MKSNSMVKDLTNGSVPKLLFAFAAPLFVSNALQAIYNIVDMIVVGQVIGGSGMSAVSTGGNILHLLTFVAMGFQVQDKSLSHVKLVCRIMMESRKQSEHYSRCYFQLHY